MQLAVAESATQPNRVALGNCWLIAATAFNAMLGQASPQPGAPLALLVNADGDFFTINAEHPHYADSLKSMGFVALVEPGMDLLRLAARIRAAMQAHATAAGP